VAGCFILMFFVGFGAGKFVKQNNQTQKSNYTHYTTPPPKKPTTKQTKPLVGEGIVAEDVTAVTTTPLSTASTTGARATCLIKGNISSGGRKIYHTPGGALYKIVKPEQCFATEAEALAAGFKKSGR
jgi:hypothetical protein